MLNLQSLALDSVTIHMLYYTVEVALERHCSDLLWRHLAVKLKHAISLQLFAPLRFTSFFKISHFFFFFPSDSLWSITEHEGVLGPSHVYQHQTIPLEAIFTSECWDSDRSVIWPFFLSFSFCPLSFTSTNPRIPSAVLTPTPCHLPSDITAFLTTFKLHIFFYPVISFLCM